MATRNPINFRHLQCFLTIAQERTVSGAAVVLNISQPALSKTLRELEGAVGIRLFSRHKSGMMLTHYGDVFLQHAAASVGSLRHGIDGVRHARQIGGVGLSIGALPNVAAWVIPLAVSYFKQNAPNTSVHVVSNDNSVLLGRLRLGDLAFVVGRLAQPEHMAGLSFEKLYDEPLTLVVRPGHPLASARRFGIQDIAELPWLVPPQGTIIRNEIDRFLMAAGLTLSANMVETTSIAFGLGYVSVTDAVWFVPRGAVEHEIAESRLVELPAEESALSGPVGITIRADTPPTAVALVMMEAVRDVVRSRGSDRHNHFGMVTGDRFARSDNAVLKQTRHRSRAKGAVRRTRERRRPND